LTVDKEKRRIRRESGGGKKTNKSYCTLFMTLLMFLMFPHGLNSEEPPCKIVLAYECTVNPLYGNAEIEAFVKNTIIKRRKQDLPNYDKLESEGNLHFGTDRIYIVDLNKDNSPEYIVPFDCGGTGNCSFLIFADHPARILGEINAEYIIFEPQANKWPDIMEYGHMSAGEGVIYGYTFKDGQYQEDPKVHYEVYDSIDGKTHTKTDFFKQLGPVKCECEGK
jgi:hypothetical protein